MSNKLSYEDVSLFVRNKNCELITAKEDYQNILTNITVKCSCGNEYLVTFKNFRKSKFKCKKCVFKERVGNRLQYCTVNNLISKHNCTLISKEYIGENSPLEIRCECGEIFSQSYMYFKKSPFKRCDNCIKTIKKRHYYNRIAEFIHLHNCSLITTFDEFMIDQRLTIKCECGEIFTSMFSSFKSSKYHKCEKCGHVLYGSGKRIKVNDVTRMFANANYIILDGLQSCETSISRLKIKCPNGHVYTTSIMNFTHGHRCRLCGRGGPGKANHGYKGGITRIAWYVRSLTKPWINDSLQSAGYKCIISGRGGKLAVHHGNITFKEIFREVLSECQIPIRDTVGSYTEEELSLMSELILKKHYEYGLGYPMLVNLHLIFHSLYGKENNTYEQIIEFKNRYNAGEFIEQSA